MVLDRIIKDLLLSLNINSKKYTYSLIVDYKYSHQLKVMTPRYKLTIWERTTKNKEVASKCVNYFNLKKKRICLNA